MTSGVPAADRARDRRRRSAASTTPASTAERRWCATTRGSARRLRCQYHSWTYEIDGGSLVPVPDERDFVGLDWEQRCLPRVSCDTFGGFVFVNRDPEAQPLADWIGPGGRDVQRRSQCETLREVYRESVIVPCNWKVTAEAFLEVYHFRPHPLAQRRVDPGQPGRGHGPLPQRPQPHDHAVLRAELRQARSGMAGVGRLEADSTTGEFPRIDGVPAMVDCTSTAVSLSSRT